MIYIWIAVGSLFIASIGLTLKVRRLEKQLKALPTRIEPFVMEPAPESAPARQRAEDIRNGFEEELRRRREDHERELELVRARYRGFAS